MNPQLNSSHKRRELLGIEKMFNAARKGWVNVLKNSLNNYYN